MIARYTIGRDPGGFVRRLRPDGLTTQQAALITVVERLDSPSLTQAALALGTTHQNLRQVADALVRKGFLSIEPDAEDGRVRRLVTTAKSDEYWRRSSPAGHRRVLDWFEAFSDDDVRTLSSLLWRLEGMCARRTTRVAPTARAAERPHTTPCRTGLASLGFD